MRSGGGTVQTVGKINRSELARSPYWTATTYSARTALTFLASPLLLSELPRTNEATAFTLR